MILVRDPERRQAEESSQIGGFHYDGKCLLTDSYS
jgi:hypothetical protein